MSLFSKHLGAFLSLSLIGLAVSGCSSSQPCDDYVDYICQCHQDDPDYDCEQVKTAYEGAEPQVQDECALNLDELEQKDQEEGSECTVESAA